MTFGHANNAGWKLDTAPSWTLRQCQSGPTPETHCGVGEDGRGELCQGTNGRRHKFLAVSSSMAHNVTRLTVESGVYLQDIRNWQFGGGAHVFQRASLTAPTTKRAFSKRWMFSRLLQHLQCSEVSHPENTVNTFAFGGPNTLLVHKDPKHHTQKNSIIMAQIPYRPKSRNNAGSHAQRLKPRAARACERVLRLVGSADVPALPLPRQSQT